MSEPRTYIRNDFIHTVLVVSSKQRIQIEHGIFRADSYRRNAVCSSRHPSECLSRSQHLHHTYILLPEGRYIADVLPVRGEPFADGKIQRRTDTLAKTSCLIIISKSCFGTTAYKEKQLLQNGLVIT